MHIPYIHKGYAKKDEQNTNAAEKQKDNSKKGMSVATDTVHNVHLVIAPAL